MYPRSASPLCESLESFLFPLPIRQVGVVAGPSSLPSWRENSLIINCSASCWTSEQLADLFLAFSIRIAFKSQVSNASMILSHFASDDAQEMDTLKCELSVPLIVSWRTRISQLRRRLWRS